jgi:hypothetical protein
LRSRNRKTGGIMADNDQSKIRYDDFIGSVQPDPAKPESTIMLSGFVGHGPEGHARVYPDPTLGTWYDIPEGDILHSMPIADSKLGGSYVWVRASSEIKPGSAAPAATETEAVQPQQAAAAVNPTPRTHCHVCDPPKAAAAMQPTPTPQTHCFICPPHTLAANCWTAPVVCDTMQLPTPATHCINCPPHTQNCTPATICTLHGHCPPPQPSAAPTLCTVPPTLPCSLLCQADPRAPAALPHTAATVCTQFGCPPHTMVPTVWCSWVGCAPHGPAGGAPAGLEAAPQQANTGVTVCFTDCLPPGNQMRAAVGINPMDPTPATRCFFCDPPGMAAAAMQPTPTVQTHCFICPPHTLGIHCWTAPVVCGILPPSFGCQQGGPQHAMAMAAPAHPNTAATLCTQQPACPPHTLATLRTSWFECHTNMAGCTVHICAQAAPQAQGFGTLGPNQHTVGGAAITQCCPAHTHVGCPPNTVNTPCATFVCPTLGVCPTVAACTPNGVFTPFGR